MPVKSKIKVLHIGKYFPPFMGGIENFMSDLMDEQSAAGMNVRAIVHHHDKSEPLSREQDEKYVIHRIPILGVFAFTPIAPSFLKEFNKVLAEFCPDIIHIHMPNVSAFWCLFSPKAFSIPWVIHWHSDVVGNVPDLKIKLLYPFYRIFETKLLSKTKSIIATSPNYAKGSQVLGRFDDKVTVVPLGITEKEMSAQVLSSNSAFGSQNTSVDLSMLMIGRLTYYKGHENLIRAVAELTKGTDKRSSSCIKLNIIGDGELKERLTSLTNELGIHEQVTFSGKVTNSELHQAIEQCDLLCLPSIEKTEAFGVVLLEAARQHKPSLVTNVCGSGMSWVVQHKKTGLVVRPDSVVELVESLNWCANNKPSLVEMGKHAFTRFENNFSITPVSKLIEKEYFDVLDKTN